MARAFSVVREELKCEALVSVMADCACEAASVVTYFACAETTGGLCRTSHVGTHVCCSGAEDVLIPADVRELCDGCFKGARSLRRVTFGPASSLERIGVSCFAETQVEEVSIPDGVRELFDGCFQGCKSLRRVMFGPSSLLERIGVSCFEGSGVEEVFVPDGVRELCDGCFKGCSTLPCDIRFFFQMFR